MSSGADRNLPRHIGAYKTIGRLATGGMAELYLGCRSGPSGFRRPVAIKRILPHLCSRETFVTMFLDEAKIAAAIQHPNVVSVEELSRDGEDLFIVMEYLAGESLAFLVRYLTDRGRQLDLGLAAYIVAEVAAGLHAAHSMLDDNGEPLNVVHRDVSPQNIFITYDGQVKVIDFGVAQAADRLTKTETGLIKGKFEYMSPEQVRGEPLDRRSDLFALGTVLYEALTARKLFKRANNAATIRAVLEHRIQPPSELRAGLPDSLNKICFKTLARSRRRRYQAASELRGELLQFLYARPGDAQPEQRLFKLMHDHFEERVEAKRKMLRQVRDGQSIEEIVVIATEPAGELPSVPSGRAFESTTPLGHQRATRRRFWPIVVALLTLTSLSVVAGIIWGLSDGLSQPRESRPTSDSVSLIGASQVPAKTVRIAVASRPAGATVSIDGSDKLQTPGELTLPHGMKSVVLGIHLDGYQPIEEVIVPDVDQRLRVTLTAESESLVSRPQKRRLDSHTKTPSGVGQRAKVQNKHPRTKRPIAHSSPPESDVKQSKAPLGVKIWD